MRGFTVLLAVATAPAATTAADQHDEPINCEIAVIGAGPGGAYSAFRLVEGRVSKSVCLFEQLGRVGGRVHSLRNVGPRKDLVVETGAYRFALNKTCAPLASDVRWCIDTPVTTHTIVNRLGLKWKRYDPLASQWDNWLAKIVDDQGEDRGYLTFVEQLVALVEASDFGRVMMRHELESMHLADGGGYELRFANGAVARAAHVILNVPQHPLLRILARSTGVGPGPGATADALHAVIAFPLMKLYVHYTDAWWRNALGLDAGPFNNSEAWHSADSDDPRKSEGCLGQRQAPVPLLGAYHDGDVRCDGPPGARCRGYIQAAYTNSLKVIRRYAQYRVARSGDAVTHIDATTGLGARLLDDVHAAMIELHRPGLEASGELARAIAATPDSAILTIWDQGAEGIESGCHMYASVPRTGPGITQRRLSVEALTPFATAPDVHVVNEAFGQLECFAEGSLQMAENLVHRKFKVPRPAWIPKDVYESKVLFNATAMNDAPNGGGAPAPGGDLVFAQAGM